jgi:hypothetical protein
MCASFSSVMQRLRNQLCRPANTVVIVLLMLVIRSNPARNAAVREAPEDDDDVVEDLVRIPQLRRPPYGRAASTAGVTAGQTDGSRRPASGEAAAFQDGVSNGSQHPMHRRHASELAGGNAHHEEVRPGPARRVQGSSSASVQEEPLCGQRQRRERRNAARGRRPWRL